jgi:hypothetical protein
MGTSSIFNGRNDRNPLLPEDYDPEQSKSTNTAEPVKWQTVKSDMSKYINSGGTYGSPRHIAQQYVRAAGGSHRMASQAHSGIKAGGNIGGFFNGIITNGLEATFKNLGIEYVGKPVSEVFSRLVDIVAPDSNTKEDIAAKEAAQAALSKVFDYVEANELNLDSINSMPPELMNEALKEYIGSYIWISMMKDLGSRLEMYIADSQDSYAIECEFKDMIMGIVDVEFKNKGEIIDKNVSSAIKELHQRCLEVLEGIV